jgi:hypothetical protein
MPPWLERKIAGAGLLREKHAYLHFILLLTLVTELGNHWRNQWLIVERLGSLALSKVHSSFIGLV